MIARNILFISDCVSELPCDTCGGEVVEYSIPYRIWNAVVRSGGEEHDREYLCIWCFVDLVIGRFEALTNL